MNSPSFAGFVEKFEGEGMPLFENANLQGDLFVEYVVVLPTELAPQTRKSEYRLLYPLLFKLLTMS